MSTYPRKSTNPFEHDADDDVDDEDFLRNSRRAAAAGGASFDDDIRALRLKRREIEGRTAQSAERSIGILRDSEQIGIATAEELARQREQLERTDKRLDEINATLRFSQKHINGIRSVFSSLRNFVSGKGEGSPAGPVVGSPKPTPENSNLKETLATYDKYENHPSTRLHASEPSVTQASGSKDISARLDANLQEMCTSISRLKGLATDLSYEIDTQNDLIDDITTKTEKADGTIHRQNKDMNRILKK